MVFPESVSPEGVFSDNYAEARQRFLATATQAGAELTTFRHPGVTDSNGGALHVDLARLGPATAGRALLCVSGTHGVEGYAGSACQLALLCAAVPADTSVLLVHVLNPYGFAYRRRVNEDNVDLNRNFVDHTDPPPNTDYAHVHPALVPADWDGAVRRAADERLMHLAAEYGTRRLQAVITYGQWTHADGLFYGGNRPAWSHQVFRTVVDEQLRGHRRIAYVDLHTGLGAWGRGEPIFRGGAGSDVLGRARAWYGPELTVPAQDTSSSTPITGNTAHGVIEALSEGQELTAITLEFGTLAGPEVLDALRADNWLHLQPDPPAALAEAIKYRISAAFYPSEDSWRRAVLDRSREVFNQAFAGLAR
ncbi:MAG: M14 family metallopeptidase [Pseudonocardiaceae bacterium]